MLAVIPARGGSVGVPNKNIKLLNNKPLIAYTIEAALASAVFERVIVSTDSEKIAEVAREYGAETPFMRPAAISDGETSSDDVILHALDFYTKNGENYKYVSKLQPTSPLRTAKHIKEAYRLMMEQKATYVVSICECEHSPLWSGRIGENNSLDNFISEEVKRACRQNLPAYYRLNGAIYMAESESFRKSKNFFGKNSMGYIMSQNDSVDIDSYLDFRIAEIIIEQQKENSDKDYNQQN